MCTTCLDDKLTGVWKPRLQRADSQAWVRRNRSTSRSQSMRSAVEPTAAAMGNADAMFAGLPTNRAAAMTYEMADA
eukprot:3573530-Prymnesium_polylepis.1